MKELHSFQEIADRIRQGKRVTFISPLTAEVILHQQDPHSEKITVTIALLIGEYAVGEFTSEYDDIEVFLDAFDINTFTHMWEVLE